ncbi:uncharacterized protein [Branchiostoma lanceolatum]|uniref:uncharacterized protein n=1 Tax=Branchiostoma lanceolatum TaxID=7740 RepID=UPI003455E599
MPTRENAILDQILANDILATCYQEPTTDPPIGDSDHNCVIWEERPTSKTGNETHKKQVRPLRESDLRAFGCWITGHDWEEVYCADNTQEKSSAFYTTLLSAVDSFFPVKTVRIHKQDKPWINPHLKTLIRDRQRAFAEGNRPKWKHLRNKISKNIQSSKKAFYRNKIEPLKTTDPRKWYNAIKEITNCSKGQLCVEVPGVPSSSPKAVASAINVHLAAASQQHAPLQLQDLPAYLPAPAPPLFVSFWDMWHRLKKVKIGKATGSDNISPRIVREFAFELCQPLCDIMNTSLCGGVVPDVWKDADVIPVPKEMPPSLSKLRPISLTSVFAKHPPPPPVITVGPTQLEVVEYARILGIILQSNLKWTKHVEMILSPDRTLPYTTGPKTTRTMQKLCSLPTEIPDLQRLPPTVPRGDFRQKDSVV